MTGPKRARSGVALTLAAVLALLGPSSVTVRGEDKGAPAQGGEGVPSRAQADAKALQEAVARAIDSGVGWLKSFQIEPGAWVDPSSKSGHGFELGHQSLVMLALAKSGMPSTDPTMKRAIEVHDRMFRAVAVTPKLDGAQTYDLACTVLMYHALSEGGTAGRPSAEVIDRVKSIVKFFERTQLGSGIWGYPTGQGDLSNTQYVLFALEMASRMGVRSKPEVFGRVVDHMLSDQEASGPEVRLTVLSEAPTRAGAQATRYAGPKVTARGFRYERRGDSTANGSMTASGLGCLAVCKGQLVQMKSLKPDMEKRIDDAARSALGWLTLNYTVDRTPGVPPPGLTRLTYYLYGLERAGSMLGVPNLGEHDWYGEGATSLLRRQDSDGSWTVGLQGPLVDTCLALLFLRRGTGAPTVPISIPSITGAPDSK